MVSTETIQSDEQLQHCLHLTFIKARLWCTHPFVLIVWNRTLGHRNCFNIRFRPIETACVSLLFHLLPFTFYFYKLHTRESHILNQFFTQIKSQICAYEEGTTTN